MKEIEVKILEIDKDSLVRKLESLGAIKIFEGGVDAEFFTNREGKKVRLRKMGNENILTYKERIEMPEAKYNNEYEISFDHYENLVSILRGIGFEKSGEKSKKRLSYRIGSIIYDFDKYEDIPWFVEVESESLE